MKIELTVEELKNLMTPAAATDDAISFTLDGKPIFVENHD